MPKLAQVEIVCFYPYILVEPLQQEETKNEDGVYIPTSAESSVLEAKVVAIPDNDEQLELSIGDTVFLKKYSTLKIHATDYRFVNVDEDLLGKKNN